MAAKLFRKTIAGQAEVLARRLSLDRRTRALLILCNGKLDTAALHQHLQGPVDEPLDHLCSLGLLEALPEPEAVPRPAARPDLAPADSDAAPLLAPLGSLLPSQLSAQLGAQLSSQLGAQFGARVSSRLSSLFGARGGVGVTTVPSAPASDTLATTAVREAVSPTQESDALKAIVQRGWLVLGPLFGPGVEERMAPLLRARDHAQMRRALDELRDALAVYRGRKDAVDLVRRIEQG